MLKAVGDCLLDFLAGLIVFTPVTVLFSILIVLLLQELIVFSLPVTSFLCVRGLLRGVRYLKPF